MVIMEICLHSCIYMLGQYIYICYSISTQITYCVIYMEKPIRGYSITLNDVT